MEYVREVMEDNVFEEEVDKCGIKFGKSYSTHMFKVELKIPTGWAEDPESEVHFRWNANCEASLYNPYTGKHLSALSSSGREVYKIKVAHRKNDLEDQELRCEKTSEGVIVRYLLELACQEMFGVPKDGQWGAQPDLEREFELTMCEIGLFNS